MSMLLILNPKLVGPNHDEKSSRKKVMRLDCVEIQSNGDTIEVRYCVKRSPLIKYEGFKPSDLAVGWQQISACQAGGFTDADVDFRSRKQWLVAANSGSI